MLGKPTQQDTLVHFQTQAKWPFKPRDAVTLFRLNQPEPNQIQILMLNQPQSLEEVDGYVRVQHSQGHGLLTALHHCRTQVQYESGSKRGSAIPHCLVNSLNRFHFIKTALSAFIFALPVLLASCSTALKSTAPQSTDATLNRCHRF